MSDGRGGIAGQESAADLVHAVDDRDAECFGSQRSSVCHGAVHGGHDPRANRTALCVTRSLHRSDPELFFRQQRGELLVDLGLPIEVYRRKNPVETAWHREPPFTKLVLCPPEEDAATLENVTGPWRMPHDLDAGNVEK